MLWAYKGLGCRAAGLKTYRGVWGFVMRVWDLTLRLRGLGLTGSRHRINNEGTTDSTAAAFHSSRAN